MINRFVNLVFIDSFAIAINVTLGTLLRTKICNYSWDGVVDNDLSTLESSNSSCNDSSSVN
ncbi:hypothetical protein NIES37_33480 [Tolypothrix tenuis PCC 7101]|uniref:Uncharacterized protein n=1 Tax=Tolypothrix tenuis PCC 7101 TaxID=231146 RepID=A0A1Z4N0V3_9CYAN|nr:MULTISPECIES: hypothetical protein [unclassified Tolypothrix]BAY89795.1 hypothetical protein NIES3275_17980 [Microchaete diplosiphon NIES-3275]BAY99366.1 hypothetical protein NIES37_33480 [Tolypothrix tenuis PCC 7101]BAZ76713.1 hypothetical protein NIES50_53120 [Aulosira laxa NIES-50]MBE9083442.1 hypothetical protein [Tolypothrix sp. LEGE 11397]UYD24050.1 hypothetical protein HGR01_21405 [Tolypothrix sp. PCC 7712]